MLNRSRSTSVLSTITGATATFATVVALGAGLASANPAPAAAPTASDITWEECPPSVDITGAECGRLEVPTYYDNPDAGSISVGFVRVKAANPDVRRGALFTNPGGPGGDAYSWAGSNNIAQWPEEIRNEWDVIGVQPRGLPGSTPISCDPAAPQGIIEFLTQYGALTRAGCEKNQPGYSNSLTTENTTHDWEAVRQALGEDRISILGLSYGTFLASAYSTFYPQNTDKVILDSGVDPKQAWGGILRSQIDGYHDGLHEFMGYVADRNDTYGMGTTPLQVYENWSRKVASEAGVRPTALPPNAEIGDLPPGLEFAGQPGADIMTATGELRVQVEHLQDRTQKPMNYQVTSPTLNATRQLVPMAASWEELAQFISGQAPEGIPELSEEETQAILESQAQTMAMQSIVVCNEHQTPPEYRDLPPFLWSNYFTADPFIQFSTLYSSGVGCAGRGPVTSLPNFDGSALETKPLQIQGTRDPQTPYHLHTGISRPMQSHVVTVQGPGHGHVAMGNKAVDDIAVEFLRSGHVGTSDAPGLN
ncbi:MAG: alpha/beta hydrolase [Corynebacterium camporealensis]|uniref:alpha/beta hydrolase n=1 Tax=Corynebacterium camporealensis TaxID=161896 RepID=UPI002A90ECA1|nr:alpha/beta hydrolase [Corynebacterium camporealensis]MDY5840231.1 alpha/beta hydrolase [Corynebacterium camporealensis]